MNIILIFAAFAVFAVLGLWQLEVRLLKAVDDRHRLERRLRPIQ